MNDRLDISEIFLKDRKLKSKRKKKIYTMDRRSKQVNITSYGHTCTKELIKGRYEGESISNQA